MVFLRPCKYVDRLNIIIRISISCICVYVQAGYEGDDCQVDIDECEQHPCHNGGKCFQRSDVVNYRKLPELSTADFSYDVAAGFICHCLPGFIGKPDKNHLSFSACCLVDVKVTWI